MKLSYALYLAVALSVLLGVYKLYEAFHTEAKACIDMPDLQEKLDCFANLTTTGKPASGAEKAVSK